jgi:hypothetical protein
MTGIHGAWTSATAARGVIEICAMGMVGVLSLPAPSAAAAGTRSPAASNFGRSDISDQDNLEANLLHGQLAARPTKETHRPLGGLVDRTQLDPDGLARKMWEVVLQFPVEDERDIRIELFLKLPELAVTQIPGAGLEHGEHEHVIARVVGKGIEHSRPLDSRAGRGRIRAGQIFPEGNHT